MHTYGEAVGQVIVADGTPRLYERLERVLASDPGRGVIRHADARHDDVVRTARREGVRVPMRERPAGE
jgi:urocanate hydratase